MRRLELSANDVAMALDGENTFQGLCQVFRGFDNRRLATWRALTWKWEVWPNTPGGVCIAHSGRIIASAQ